MPKARGFTPAVALAGLAALPLGLAGCDGDSTAPVLPGGPTQFSREVTLQEFQNTVRAGVARPEIELLPGGLIVREAEIEDPGKLADDEEVESPITAIDEAAGTIKLALGGLEVRYSGATRFRGARARCVNLVPLSRFGTGGDERADRASRAEPQAPK